MVEYDTESGNIESWIGASKLALDQDAMEKEEVLFVGFN